MGQQGTGGGGMQACTVGIQQVGGQGQQGGQQGEQQAILFSVVLLNYS